MSIESMKNMVVLRNLPSNIVEEAIVILKPNIKLKNLDLAEKLARTVERTRKSVTLEPMTAYERKIIHTKLQNNSKVKTFSKGEEPYRKVVISLK